MADYDFPALGFDPAPGDVAQLRAAGDATRAYVEKLGTQRDTLNRMDTSTWIGDAGEAFRDKVKDLPRDLGTAHDAHGTVVQALTGYADALSAGQTRARDLEQRAAEAQRKQQAAHQNVQHYQSIRIPTDDPRRPQLEADYQSAQRDEGHWGGELAGLRQQARTLLGSMKGEADKAAQRIKGAGGTAPYDKPPWWKRAWDATMDWVREHADLLKTISGVLKWVAAACALLSFIPVVGAFFGAVALIAGGAALLIDVAVKLATGEGSWWEIGLDAALTFVPGGKLLKFGGKALLKGATKVAPKLVARAAPALAKGTKAVKEAIRKPVHAAAVKVFDKVTPLGRAQQSAAKWLNGLPHARPGQDWVPGLHHASGAPAADVLAGNKALNKAWQQTFKDRYAQNMKHGFDQGAKELDALKARLGSEVDRLPGRRPQLHDPLYGRDKPMEWSHEPVPDRDGGSALVPRRPQEHAMIDPHRWQFVGRGAKEWGNDGRLAPVPDDFWSDDRQPAGVR